MIRFAEERDVEVICRMSKDFSAQLPHPLNYDEDKAAGWVNLLLTPTERRMMLVSEEDTTVTGFIAAFIEEAFFSQDLVAHELAWWVDPPYRHLRDSIRLLEAYEFWARKMGCRSVGLAVINGWENEDKLKAFHKRRGFRCVEHAYLKDLRNGD
jgi:GNAT superfamily N-acetyltransferase